MKIVIIAMGVVQMCFFRRIFCISNSAPTMYLSNQQGHPVSVKETNTIAAGLAPPYAGTDHFL